MPTTLDQVLQAADLMQKQVPCFRVGLVDAGPRWIPSNLQVMIPNYDFDEYHTALDFDFEAYRWDLIWLEFIGLHRSPAYRAEMLRQASEWERQAQADEIAFGRRVPACQNPMLEKLEWENGWYKIDALDGQKVWRHWDIFQIDADGNLSSLPFHRQFDPASYHAVNYDWSQLENKRIDRWASIF